MILSLFLLHPSPITPQCSQHQTMQETLPFSTSPSPSPSTTKTTIFPSSKHPTNFPPPLSRPKHLHFPTPSPLPKHTLINQTSNGLQIPSSPSPSPLQEKLLYLDSLGIDSFHCLSSHPPLIQTPLSEIKSVINFLYSINLTIQDIRRSIAMCPDILTSPVSSTLIPAVTFLLRDAHVAARDLRHVVHRRPRLLTCSVDKILRPTLSFLQDCIGIDDLSKWASLLSCSVELKFIPRIEYIRELGFTERETFEMFRRFPSLFCYSIEGNFEPKFSYFVVEMRRELKELVEFPQYFSFSLENRIKVRHQMCVEKGVFLSLPVMLKSPEKGFVKRLEVCCSSSMPVRTSPFWCTTSQTSTRTDVDVNVT